MDLEGIRASLVSDLFVPAAVVELAEFVLRQD
jgi:hypothetical protein